MKRRRSIPVPAWNCTFPSQLDEVDRVCLEMRNFCERRGWTSVGFGMELVLRECLNNAILHGNRRDPAKQVHLGLWSRPPWILLQVADEGPGFDWKATRRRGLPQDESVNGRGLCIAQVYARRVHFNTAGNQISLWFQQPSDAQPLTQTMIANTVDRQAGLCRVRIEGDLTASRVPAWQATLKRELEQPLDELVFDFADTSMLDSSGIGLLIATYNSATRKGARFRIENASAPILQLLGSMRLVNRLHVTGADATEVSHG